MVLSASSFIAQGRAWLVDLRGSWNQTSSKANQLLGQAKVYFTPQSVNATDIIPWGLPSGLVDFSKVAQAQRVEYCQFKNGQIAANRISNACFGALATLVSYSALCQSSPFLALVVGLAATTVLHDKVQKVIEGHFKSSMDQASFNINNAILTKPS